MPPPVRRLARSSLIAALLAVAPRAGAALGEPIASVDADAKALGAVRRASTAHAAFTVEQLQGSTTRIREYVSTGGTVFAVAWDGVAQPDLGVLLGSHAAEYRQAVRRSRGARARRSQRVAGEHVVVETWGHQRHLQGRAWLPAELPSGVAVDAIR